MTDRLSLGHRTASLRWLRDCQISAITSRSLQGHSKTHCCLAVIENIEQPYGDCLLCDHNWKSYQPDLLMPSDLFFPVIPLHDAWPLSACMLCDQGLTMVMSARYEKGQQSIFNMLLCVQTWKILMAFWTQGNITVCVKDKHWVKSGFTK